MTLSFRRESGADPYVGVCETGGLAPAYVLKQLNPGAPNTLSLKDTWDTPGYAGYYVFVGAPIQDGGAFAAAVRRFLARVGNSLVRFVWVPDPNAAELQGSWLAVDQGVTVGAASFSFRNLSLTIMGGCGVSLDTERAFVSLRAGSASPPFYMQTNPDDVRRPIVQSPIGLALCGEAAGTLGYRAQLNRLDLFAFGSDLRYFAPDPSGGGVRQQRYPVLVIDPPDPDGGPFIPFDVRLDPASADPAAPAHGSRNRFAFDGEALKTAYTSFFRTTTGKALTLTPQAGASLTLASTPAGIKRKSAGYYLAPSGPFTVQLAAARETAEALAPPPHEQLLCGLTGSEFVLVAPGDSLVFVPGQSAHAPSPPAGATALGKPLDSQGTTSWVTVVGARSRLAPGDPTAAGTGYYAQPESSVYFGAGEGASTAFLIPQQVQVSRLTAALSPERAAFPAVPYTGVTLMPNPDTGEPINPDLPLSTFLTFEQEVLARARRLAVPEIATGPVFFPGQLVPTSAPRASRTMLTTSAEENPTALTPQGLLATLDEAGGWLRLTLAEDPSGKGQPLEFSGASTLSQKLANALMQGHVFLVVSRSEALGTFQSKVTLQDFTFDLMPAAEGDTTKAVLLFKFREGTLVDLVNDPTTWTNPSDFNDAQGDTFPIQKYLQDYLAAASKSEDGSLEHFKQLISSSTWNGILALNCDIGSGLPTALKGLLGGMDSPLQGHHLGIEVNQVEQSPARIEKSSIFGLIRYPPLLPSGPQVPPLAEEPDPPPPYNYTVKSFHALFTNSGLSDFECKVLLTLHSLFDRPVQLRKEPHGPETLLLTGSYETHDGNTTFAFQTQEAGEFLMRDSDTLARVLSGVTISRARFTTLSATTQESGDIDIRARFSMDGTLSFQKNAVPLDLFGYDALPCSGIDLDVAFTEHAQGDRSATELTFNLSEVLFDAAQVGKPRPESLVGRFPLTLQGMRYDPEGLTTATLGAQLVQCPQVSDAWTTAPRYALRFTLPLGTLGALTSVHVSFDAFLLVGWGPHSTSTQEDAVSLAIQLPVITPGFKGFNLQGILKTTFGTANLANYDGTWMLLFNNVALSVIGIKLPPGVITDFLLFSNPSAGTGSIGNLAWFLSIQQDKEQSPHALPTRTRLFEEAPQEVADAGGRLLPGRTDGG